MLRVFMVMIVAALLGACSTAGNREGNKPTEEIQPYYWPYTSMVDPTPAKPKPKPQPVVVAPTPAAPPPPPPAPPRREVFFDYDKSVVKPEYKEMLSGLAADMKQSKAKVELDGNADIRGSSSYNQALGKRRADAVRQSLVSAGAPAGQITTQSFGKEKPRSSGTTEAAHADNRRVDIILNQ